VTDLEIVLSIAVVILAALSWHYRNQAAEWRKAHYALASEWNTATLNRMAASTRSHGIAWQTREQRKREREQAQMGELAEWQKGRQA